MTVEMRLPSAVTAAMTTTATSESTIAYSVIVWPSWRFRTVLNSSHALEKLKRITSWPTVAALLGRRDLVINPGLSVVDRLTRHIPPKGEIPRDPPNGAAGPLERGREGRP